MNQFALLVIGLCLGILASVLVVSTAVLAWIAWQTHRDSKKIQSVSLAAVQRNTLATEKMRQEVALALQAMDANRLHDASVTMQTTTQQLVKAVAFLHRLVLAGAEENKVSMPTAPPEALEAMVNAGVGSLNEMDENFIGPSTPTIFGESPKADPLTLWALKQQSRQSEIQDRVARQDAEMRETEATLESLGEDGKETPATKPLLDMEQGYEEDERAALDGLL